MTPLMLPDARGVFFMQDFPKTGNTPAIPVYSWEEAVRRNEPNDSRAFGIFATVNKFTPGNRSKDSLIQILFWSVDIDDGSKEDQAKKIRSFLVPTIVVETKRGFQVYWRAVDPTLERYDEIQKGLVSFFGGDNNARDIARILRLPGFLHLKNPEDPFEVKQVHEANVGYTEKQMLRFLTSSKQNQSTETKSQTRARMPFLQSESLFDRIYSMDCEQGLARLSGHAAVSGEKFSFHRVSSGNLNLLVDGKSTSVFIDKHKRIGSSDNGGPTIWQWINWYQRDHKKTYQFMKEVFPEIFEGTT